MAEPISEQTMQDLIDGIDRLVRSTERAQKPGGTGIGLSGSDDIFGRSVRDQFDKLIQDAAKLGQKASRGVAIQRTQQARADQDTSEGVRKANDGITKSARSASRGFMYMAKNSRLVSDAFLDVGDAIVELTKKLHAGALTAGDYAGATKKTIDSLSNMALRLGPIGVAISIAIKGFTALAVAAADQADAQFASYKELQKFGAATAGGVDDVFKLSQALNIGQKELGKLNALIGENAAGLAVFRGSVGDGAKDLAGISKDLTDEGFRDKFLRLGITIDEQNESTAAYVRLQSRLGRSQSMSVEQLAAGVAEYVQEQDKLTKLTGMTRKDQESAREAAMANEMMRVKLEEAKRSGDAAAITAAEDAMQTYVNLKSIDPSGMLATSFAGEINGFITNASKDMAALSGGSSMQIATDTTLTVAERTQKYVESATQGVDQLGSTLAKVGKFSEVFTTIDYSKFKDAEIAVADFANRLGKVEVETVKQDKGDVSPTTANLAAIEALGLETRKQTEQLVQVTVPAVVGALELVATAANKVASKLNQLAGGQTGIDQNIKTVQQVRGGANIDPFTGKTYAKGGIASGPKSGYPAELHGTEAVVPLPDGKTIPVSIQGGQGSGGGIDPGILERTNTELDTFTGFVTKLSKDFAHILRSQEDDINKGPAFGRDDQRLSLEEKSATTLIQIKDLLSEAAGIEVPTYMFGGGQAAQRGGATGGFGGGGGGGGSPMSSMGGGSGMSGSSGVGGSRASMPSMGGGGGIGGAGGRAGSMTGPSGESEEAGSLGSGITANASDLLNFTARSGSAAAFGGLNSKLKDSVLAAAEDYNAITGNKIQINSAFRDPADQQRLWDESIAADRKGRTATGMPIAQPGRSSHEKGLAVDIQNYNDPAAVAAMNRQGLSQKVPSDPVHFSFNGGGIAKGPKSGFPATLHGTEAVVPLPDGKNIPVSMPGMDTITQMLSSLPSLLAPVAQSDTITQMLSSLPSLLAPMAQSVSRTAAPNLPMMSSPGAALSSIMSSMQPPGGANATGQDANMTKVLEQLSSVLRDGQGGDQGSAQLLQQLVSLQRDQNASIVKLIQTSMA